MNNILRAHIGKRIDLSEEEFEKCVGFFKSKRLRKRQFLLQEGDICKYQAFVLKGCLREYTIDQRGEEHVLQFAVADWWIADLNSYLAGIPSTHNIDVVQDSELLLLDKESRDAMLEAIPSMERFFRLLLEANYVATHRRIKEMLSNSAEERYLAFTRAYPALVEAVPQGQIASFLGITPQSLSRIRKELSQKQ